MTGAKQIMQAQAVNNHNIANVNTVGFRADAVSFVSQPIYGRAIRPGSMRWRATPARIFRAASCKARAAISILRSTARATSRCRAADGKEAYTRAGDLRVTADGAVTTASGLPVLSESGPLNVTAGHHRHHRQRRHGLGGAARARAASRDLARPIASSWSIRRPQNLQKGERRIAAPQRRHQGETDPGVTLTSGVLESSNVNAAQSLINMIELQRLYEFQIKSMNSSDQNEQTAEQLMSNNS
jgi:flagellar basal-body rod protein FlgF